MFDESKNRAVTKIFRPLTSAQEAIYFGHLLDSSRFSFNVAHYREIRGYIQVDLLSRAIDLIVAKTPAFRSIVAAKNEELYLVTNSSINSELEMVDFSKARCPDSAAKIWIDSERKKPFDLMEGPLFKFTLIMLGAKRYYFFGRIHHIIVDGAGGFQAERSIFDLYAAFRRGLETEPAEAPDKAFELEERYKASSELDVDRCFWRSELCGVEPQLSLSGRPPVVERTFTRKRTCLSGHLIRQLKEFCYNNKISFARALIVSGALYYARMTGQKDFLIEIPVSLRKTQEDLSAVDMRSSSIILRIQLDSATTLGEVIKQFSSKMRLAYKHQFYRREYIHKDFNAEHNLAHFLINVLPSSNVYEGDEIIIKTHNLSNGPVKDINLTIYHEGKDEEVALELDCNSLLYSEVEAQLHLNRIIYFLETIAASSTCRRVEALSLTDDAEINSVVADFNDTWKDIPSTTLPEFIETQVAKTPEAIAVIFGDEEVSYQELDARANQLARYLISEGIGPEDIVAIALERSVEMVVSLLGVLKSGAAYLPLDPDYPVDRLRFMLDDSHAKRLITTRAIDERIFGDADADHDGVSSMHYHAAADQSYTLLLDDALIQESLASLSPLALTNLDRVRPLTPHHLAYLIYTSGSTGRPKGTGINHSGLFNYLYWAKKYYRPTEGVGAPVNTSIAFDATVTSLWLPLISGGSVYLLVQDNEAEDLCELLSSGRNLSLVKLTPAHISFLKERLDPFALSGQARVLVIGGEALRSDLVQPWLEHAPNTRLVNEYGPTETVVGCAVYQALRTDPTDRDVLIGSPIWNTQIYILDASLNPLPIGVVGELYIAGAGLARGYLGRSGLTSERFIANPYGSPGSRMYRTGDLARWRSDGNLEFIGRADAQVKIRGFRIELGEIESALSQIAGVGQVSVQAREVAGEKRLVAYLVAAGSSTSDASASDGLLPPSSSDLRLALMKSLPDYMVPSAFVVLDRLPLTANGKLDVRALPDPEIIGEGAYRAPETREERLVADLYAELTGASRVGLDDGFFALGGDSITAIRLVSRARQAGYDLSVKDVFSRPSVSALVDGLRPLEREAIAIIAPEACAIALTPIARQFLEDGGPIERFHQAVALEAPVGLSLPHVEAALNRLMEHHDALRLRIVQTASTSSLHYGRGLWLDPQEACEVKLETLDVSDQSPEAQEAAVLHQLRNLPDRLDPATGRMVAGVLVYRGQGRRPILLLAIHHLSVDGVSWRILFDDLGALTSGGALPGRTHSIRDWSDYLMQEAQSPSRREELRIWRDVSRDTKGLPRDGEISSSINVVGAAHHYQSQLPSHIFERLLSATPVYQVGIDDLLLTALGLALYSWRRDYYGDAETGAYLVDLEGHGREVGASGLDLTRTVGWFTSVYPVRLDFEGVDLEAAFAGASAVGVALRGVKEELRRTSDRGLGYGLLRWLNEETREDLSSAPQAEILFNYLGRFEELGKDKQGSGWRFAETGLVSGLDDEARRRFHLIDVNAAVDGSGSLSIDWGAHPQAHSMAALLDLAGRFNAALAALARHCHEEPLDQPLTPSDFPLAKRSGLDQGLLDRLAKEPGFEEVAPLAPLQQGLAYESWAQGGDHRQDPYHVQLALTLEGALDVARLKTAFGQLVRRHRILRLTLPMLALERGLGVYRNLPLDWRYERAEGRDIEELLRHDHEEAFDLSSGPLLRVRVIEISADRHVLLLSNHHALLDGWSTPILLTDLAGLYRGDHLPAAYDWRAQLDWLSTRNRAEALAYWREHLSGAEGSGSLPLERPQAPAVGMGEERFTLSSDLTKSLARFARAHDLTVSTVYQGAFLLLLGRLSGQSEITIGVTRSGRSGDRPGIERAVGLYIQSLPLRREVSLGEELPDWLRSLQEEQAKQESHGHLSLSEIQRCAGVEGGQSLFEALFVYENYPVDDSVKQLSNEIAIGSVYGVDGTHYPLALAVVPGDETRLRITYDRARVDAATIGDFGARLTRMFEAFVAAESSTRLANLSILSRSEQETVVSTFNDTQKDIPSTTLPDLFAAQASKTPEAIAVIFGDEEVSYQELDARANQLARYLISEGIGPEDIVAIALERSVEMVVSLLGVLKSGAAYLPLDPDYPVDRLRFMLDDSHAKRLITTRAIDERLRDQGPATLISDARLPSALVLDDASTLASLSTFSGTPVTNLDRVRPLTPNNLAYVIYTSGTTGQAKGSGIPHNNVISLIIGCLELYDFRAQDIWTLYHSYAFDFSVWELWGPFLTGATVVVVPDQIRKSFYDFRDLLAKQKVTVLNQTPSAFYQLANIERELSDARSALCLRYIIFGGEALDPKKLLAWPSSDGAPDPQFRNMYGITETTVHVTHVAISREIAAVVEGSLVGGPIPNWRAYVLDASLNPLPIGVVGELYIAGAGLARGYLGRSGLTSERFIANPYGSPGSRMYRTGDLARWRSDGNLEFIGRADAQVKIRGFRIELGEIESALSQIAGVGQVSVQAREVAGEKRLVAYLVAAGSSTSDASATDGLLPPSSSDLRLALMKSLPDYMVPSAFVVLDRLPLTANGKLDVRALPAPEITGEAAYRAPETSIQKLIAELYAELTGASRVGLDDGFFALGGHSLSAMRLVARVREALRLELPLRALFETPSVEGLSAAIDELRASSSQESLYAEIIPGSGRKGDEVVLSYGQARMWTLDRIEGGTASYNMPAALRISGAFDVEAFGLALRDVVDRHEPLRTVIVESEAGPQGRVRDLPDAIDIVSFEDLSLLSGVLSEERIRERIDEESDGLFDLSSDLLVRACVLRVGVEDHVLILVLHHSASDGVSMPVLIRDLSIAYVARLSGQAPAFRPLSVSYADYAQWQRVWFEESGALDRQLGYWRKRLSGAPELLSLPTDRARRADRSRAAGSVAVEIDRKTSTALEALGRRHGTTLFAVLMGLYGALLGRLARQDDVVIGFPVAGRSSSQTQDLVGFFVNTLVLRIDLSGGLRGEDLIEQVKSATVEALSHQDAPFERLVEDLAVDRSLSHTPLFQAMFAWLDQEETSFRLGGASVEGMVAQLSRAKFDVTLFLSPRLDGSIAGSFEYDASLFDEGSVISWRDQFKRLIEGVVADETREIEALSLISPQEREIVVTGFNDTRKDIPSTTLPDLFAAQASKTPEAIAVIFGDEEVSYQELDARANQLARYLISEGIGPEDIVAIALERSVEMVVSLLGVLKSGAAYLPLDPDYPVDRLRFMLDDSHAKRLITTRAIDERLRQDDLPSETSSTAVPAELVLDDASTLASLSTFSGTPVTNLDRIRPLTHKNLAYLIYTSGSTGRPKGVIGIQQALVNRLIWSSSEVKFEHEEICFSRSTIAFIDGSTELMAPLIIGNSIYLLNSITRSDPIYIINLLTKTNLHRINLVPTFVNLLIEELKNENLEAKGKWVISGEFLSETQVKQCLDALPECRIYNFYGMTEGAGDSAALIYESAISSIGSPIWNTQIYILDASLNPLPIGVVGELYIAGAGLARGYLGRSGLTSERFIANPYGSPGSRMYRTGDLARWRSDGNLEFIGRADAQVKIRGFRIELGEIESALSQIAGVGQVSVQAREVAGEKRLVAYLVAAGSSTSDASASDGLLPPSSSDLRLALMKSLPDYMVPSAFVVLDRLPLTANGKLDVRALPDPEIIGEGAYRAPETREERLVADLYAELTGASQVGLDDGFFALGGHSLLAMRLIARIREATGTELPLRALFESPDVGGLAARLSALSATTRGSIVAGLGRQGDEVVLSYGQARMWALDKIEGGSSSYNMPSAVRIRGAFDVEAFGHALREIVFRHEPLRTVIVEGADGPIGRLRDIGEDLIGFEDLSDLSGSSLDAAIFSRIEASSARVFDLGRDLMVRANVLRVSALDHVLILVAHHIANDGVSYPVLIEDLGRAYASWRVGHAPSFAPLPVSYADYAYWQREWFDGGGELDRQLSYWRERLSGSPELLSLPTDYGRRADRSRSAGHVPVHISASAAAGLEAVAQSHGTTLFAVLIGVYGALLGRLSRQEDVLIGFPVAGRPETSVEGLVGFFVNTLVLRLELSAELSGSDLIDQAGGRVVEALSYQEAPFDRLVEDLAVARSLSHTPVFQAMFAWLDQAEGLIDFGGASVERLPAGLSRSKFDVTLSLGRDADGSLSGSFEYDASLFAPETLVSWSAQFERLLAGLLEDGSRPIALTPLLGSAERRQVIEGFNDTAHETPLTTLPDLFAAQASKTPEAIAVIFGDEEVSYQELDGRANQLARYLISEGIGPEDIVAIALERSVEMVVSLLGVLKSGAAYLPLDPDYPVDRLRFMLDDSHAKRLITTRAIDERLRDQGPATLISDARLPSALVLDDASTLASLSTFSGTPVTNLDRVRPLTPHNLAYVIYTSGTTGKPKGVGVSEANLCAFIASVEDWINAGQKLLALTTIAFDIAGLELYLPLMRGASVMLLDRHASRDPYELVAAVKKDRPDIIQATPSLWGELIGANLSGSFTCLVGGEACSRDLLDSLSRYGQVINLYGPTETTIWSSSHIDHSGEDNVSIGGPLANEAIYILDASLNPLPIGVVGELYIAGAGLARGYLGRSGLTSERFIANPYGSPGSRMYRTGDLARWRSDGNLEFIGRADAQVKIRGFRIELGEIESALSQIAGVGQVSVQAREVAGEKRLVAYLVAAGSSTSDASASDGLLPPSSSDLRLALMKSLPDYMVPSAFVVLDRLPLTANGKLDVRALPDPEIIGEGAYRAPETREERLVADLYAELTGASQVGLDDGFFALGGHSLLAMRLIARIREATGTELPLRALFESPDVGGLAARLSALSATTRGSIVAGLGRQGDEVVLSYGQARMWALDKIEGGSSSYNMPSAVRIRGAFDVEAFGHALREIVFRHEPLRTVIVEGADGPIGRLRDIGEDLIGFEDLSDLSGSSLDAAIFSRIEASSARVFDLGRDLMVRANVLRVSALDHVLILVAHHIANDGVSYPVLIEDLGRAYASWRVGHAPSFAPLPVSYADYAYWQREWFDGGGELDRQLSYWRERLSGSPELLSLPTDYGRRADRSRSAGHVPVHISASAAAGLEAVAQSHGTTLFAVLIGVYGALLGRLSRQEDVLIGFPVAGRPETSVEGLVGFFVNTLVLRLELSAELSGSDLIDQAGGRVVEALSYQEAPFDRLVEDLAVARSLSHTPVFQAMFAWLDQAEGLIDFGGASVERLPAGLSRSKFDVTLSLGRDADGSLSGSFEYDASLFAPETLVSWSAQFERLLAGLLEDGSRPIALTPLLGSAERRQVIEGFNDTAHETPLTTLPDLFAAQASKTPEAIAVIFGDEEVSYQELDGRANQLARYLISEGIGPEDIVAIALERSVEMVVSLLGVLKSGAAYLPLDPDYPVDRLRFMLDDSHAKRLITTRAIDERLRDQGPATLISDARLPSALVLDDASTLASLSTFSGTPVTNLDRIRPLTPNNLAYVIYTSGTTGQAKGSGIPHNNVISLIIGCLELYDFRAQDIWTLYHSYAFDFSVWELWGPFLTGATVVVVPDQIRKSFYDFRDLLAKQKVTVLNQTPSAFYQLANIERELSDARSALCLRYIIFGGEALDPKKLLAWPSSDGAPDPQFRNMYGITETTVHVTHVAISREIAAVVEGSLVGGPIPNWRAYVLDASLNPLPIGVVGELYIAGAGLARGYLGRSGLTSERFIANPYGSPGSRMYRTGDLARWRSDGTLEFIGRADAQVKIRGFRIELGEIESALSKIAGVGQVSVQAREVAGEKRLVAYLVAAGSSTSDASATDGLLPPSSSDLRLALMKSLPDYMVPSAFVVLDRLPLTANGKLDVRALPAPEITGEAAYRAPETSIQKLIAELYAELTGASRVGLDDGFFALGGHSLSAMRLVARVREALRLELPLRALFETPSVEGLSAAIDELRASSSQESLYAEIIPGSGRKGDEVVLSYGQARMWTLDRIEGGTASYNMPAALRISGAFDVEAFGLALRDVVDRHEPLRTVIVESEAGPQGRVRDLPDAIDIVSFEDLSLLSGVLSEERIRERIDEESDGLFDLSSDLLVRACVLRVGVEDHVLILVLHHSASDGVSMPVLIRDLSIAYVARLSGQAPAFRPLSVSYADYAQWQRVWFEESGALDRQLGYWRKRLSGAPELLSLPTDRARRADRSRAAGSVAVEIDRKTSTALEALGRRHGTTLFAVLMGLYGALLGRLARQDDVVIGFPVAGRSSSQTQDLVGFFVNTLVLRIDLSGGLRGEDLIEQVKSATVEALSHQDAPFERLVEDLAVDRSLSHTPLFQAMFAWLDQEETSFRLGGASVEGMVAQLSRAKFDVTLFLSPRLDGSIAGSFEYDASLFDEGSVISWRDQFKRLIEGVVADETREIEALSLISPQEREIVVTGFNDTRKDIPSTTLPDLFAAQASKTPEAIAVIFGDEEVSYQELDARANQLARYLISEGIGPEDIVAIALERSVEMVVSLLGVLKSGAAYLPLDPDYPVDRLRFMLDDSHAKRLITTRAIDERLRQDDLPSETSSTAVPAELVLDDASTLASLSTFSGTPVTNLDRIRPLTHKNLAYVIYTSGTTGQAKGSGIPHNNVISLIIGCLELYDFRAQDIWTLYHSYAFDFSVWELWGPFLTGATVVVVPDQIRKSFYDFRDLLAKQKVTVLNQTPSAFYQLANIERELSDARSALCLRYIIFGGEALDPKKLLAWPSSDGAPDPQFRNMYGITETTVHVTHVAISREIAAVVEGSLVGGPIPNWRAYVLDASLNPLPIGVVGELYIAGAGLARGYLGRSGLTSERFIANPYGSPGSRMYRTGDLARWRSDGNLEFIGRADAQVKIRGFRIELGEIESALSKIAGVGQVSVQAREVAGEKRLVAYLVAAGSSTSDASATDGLLPPSSSDLRLALMKSLPDYMVPSAFVVLDRLPLTANGKLDVRALPAPEITGEAAYRAPETSIQKLIAELYAELTGASRVGLDDGFFALGGHSLSAMRLVARVREAIGVEMPLRALFENPSVESMAKILSDNRDDMVYRPILPLRLSGNKQPLFCIHPAGGTATVFSEFARHLKTDCPVLGIQARGLELYEEPFHTFAEMITTYIEAIVEKHPKGKLYIVGYSAGGAVAHEIACRLEDQGRDIGLVGLIDSSPFMHEVIYPTKRKEEVLRVIARRYGLEIDDHLPTVELYRLAVEFYTEQGIVPRGTPVSWVDRMLNEMILSSQRLATYVPRKGNFNTVYFSAEAEDLTPKSIESRLAWKEFCRNVSYFPIQSTHMRMLDRESSKAIAAVIDALLAD